MPYCKVIAIGTICRGPEIRVLPSQAAVCDFGLAISRRWRDQAGRWKGETCYIDCTLFGKQAEAVYHTCKEGNQLLVEGHLHHDRWTGKDGQKHSRHKIAADYFQLLSRDKDKKGDEPEDQPQSSKIPYPAAEAPEAAHQPPRNIDAPPDETGGDIPF
jgi:single-strand DNA-binding protein